MSYLAGEKDNLISDATTDAAAKAMREAFAAEAKPTTDAVPEPKLAPKTTAKDAVEKAHEDPDELLDLEDVDLTDEAPIEDEWDALKKLGVSPKDITAALAKNAAQRDEKPDLPPSGPSAGLSAEQTKVLRTMQKRNPEAAAVYLESILAGQSIDPLEADPDAPPEEVLTRRLQRQEQQLAQLQWQLVEKDLGGRVQAALSKFEILKSDPEDVTDITKSVIAEVCQDKTVDHTNVDSAIHKILERHSSRKLRTIRRYLEGKKAQQKQHPPSQKGASVGSPAKKPVQRERFDTMIGTDIEAQVAAALRRDMGPLT